MFLRILKSERLLFVFLLISHLCAYQLQLNLIYPLETALGLEITQHASMFFLPGGISFLSFYLLRWKGIPIIIFGNTCIDFFMFGSLATSMLAENVLSALFYPLCVYVANKGGWDILGDVDENKLTMTGTLILQWVVSLYSSLFSAYLRTANGVLDVEQNLQYVLHFIVGDTLGAAAVVYIFYKLMKISVR